MNVGDIVHSADPRDDERIFFVVQEVDIPHASGPCVKVAVCGVEEHGYYRNPALLVPADPIRELERS